MSTQQQIIELAYDPQTYNGSHPPELSPVSEMLPWDKAAADEKQSEEDRRKREKEAEDKKKEEEKKGGWSSLLGKASEAATKVATSVGDSVDKVSRDMREKIRASQEARFKANLSLSDGENLLYEYACSTISAGVSVSGYLYVSSSYLSFYSLNGNSRMKFSIPLKTVVSIQHAYALPTKDGKAPFIQIVTNPNVKTDSFLIYTSDKKLHSFFKIGSVHDPVSSFYDHAFNVIDHAWRGAK